MANVSSYRQLSEIIQTEHYKNFASPSAEITQPHIAQLIATKVAKYATISAYNNSNGGDTTFANDQFVSVFYNQPLLTNSATQDKYVVLPATPAGLPKNSEITQVSFVGAPYVHVVPCLQKDTFVESLLPPLPSSIVMYRIEAGNIVFMNLPKIINANVNIKMVGAISGDSIMDALVNVPKDAEDEIRLEILRELAEEYNIKSNMVQTEAAN